MKLATYIHGRERFGALVTIAGAEVLVDLATAGRTLGHPGDALAGVQSALAFVRAGAPALALAGQIVDRVIISSAASQDAIAAPGDVVFLAPVPNPGKIVCVGANYPQHVAEIGERQSDPAVSEIGKKLSSGDYPPAFAKMPSSLAGQNARIAYPPHTAQLDYEAELAVIIGRDVRTVDNVMDAIGGYTISNDVSARDVQFREMKRGLLLHGKNFPGSAPMGPYLVTADEVGDPQDLQITCWVNGNRRQHESTRHMIFSIAQVLEHYKHLPLLPGDIIMTGSPAGVAIGMDNSELYLLNAGDTVEIEIAGLGRLKNTIVAAGAAK